MEDEKIPEFRKEGGAFYFGQKLMMEPFNHWKYDTEWSVLITETLYSRPSVEESQYMMFVDARSPEEAVTAAYILYMDDEKQMKEKNHG